MTKPNPEHKITICHNGHEIEVDYAGARGHAAQHENDVIPAFEDFPGLNIGESCNEAITTTTQSTPSTTTTTLGTPPTIPTTTVSTVPVSSLPATTTTVNSAPTPTLVTTSLPESSTTTFGPETTAEAATAQVYVPVRETLPVTGIGTPGMILVAGVLMAAGVGLVRKARRAA